MSSAFGHQIKVASQRERDNYSRWGSGCGSGKCKEPVSYITTYRYVMGRAGRTYRYVTGRAGRVSMTEKLVCIEHGRKFAKKYGLECPDASLPGVDSERTKLSDDLRSFFE
jgi:hypothetical protein